MANPFFVQPAQFGQGLQSLAGSVQQFGQQRQKQQQMEEQKAYEQQAKQAMAQAFQSGDPAAIRQAVIQFPEIAETATQMFGFTNDQTEKVARETYRRALSETDPQRRAAIMEGGIETVQQFGGNPRMMARDLQMLQENPEAAMKSMRGGFAALASEQEYESMFGPSDGKGGGFGTVNPRDFTPESLAKFARTQDYGDLVRYESQRSVDIGGVPHVFDPRIGGYRPATRDRTGLGGQPEEITTTDVAESEGEIEATKDARKQAIKMSGEARDKLSSARASIPLYDRAIQLVQEGAGTGAIESRLPSLKQSSVALDDIQRQLGLNVLQNTTFGALSEGELRLALQAGLPTSLEGEELIQELQRRKASQEKLANYLEEAAIFLGDPKNTPADWMKLQRDKREQADSGSNETVNWDDL